MIEPRPLLRLRPGQERRLKSGHPWAYSNEIDMTGAAGLQPGCVVRLEGDDGWRFGAFMFNPNSLIAARRLDRDPDAVIGAAWLRARLDAAAALRARLGLGRFHRLVHAEADGLPGLIIDRFDDVFVVQANTAGMDRLLPEIAAALAAIFAARAIVARNDSPVRAFEGLGESVTLLHGEAADTVVDEGGVVFPVSPLAGQKTGWFFDQRPNRDRMAALASGTSGARVLDVFCHVGAFGLRCAVAGADVTLVDSSAPALAHAASAAQRNGLAVRSRRGDAFDIMDELAASGDRFDIVIVDPPAFAKSRKDAAAALRAYGRLAKLGATLVAPGGMLFAASCSHHAPAEAFHAAVAEGVFRARRDGRVLWTGGAGPDHPVHLHLPESAYLKATLLQL